MKAADRIRAAARMLSLLALVLTPVAARAQPADFSGDWQTFWRTGGVVLSLSLEGDRVTGTYEPDDGTVTGSLKGRVLRGTWEQPGASGAFVLALSEGGQVLTGRFGNGEYWNGFREDDEGGSGQWRLCNASPRETLRSLLIAANVATYACEARALRQVGNLVTYSGPKTNTGNRASHCTTMFDILDMSTTQIMDVPEAPETPEKDRVRFAVGPAAVAETTELGFRPDAFGRWRLLDQPPIDRDDHYVGLKGFGASSIDIEVLCYLRVFAYGSQVEAQHALILDAVSLANEVGGEFAFPTRTIHMAGAAELRSQETADARTTPVAEGSQ